MWKLCLIKEAMSTRSATATGMTRNRDRMVVLDFGGQYSHLIVRRCRDLGVYTELLPSDVPIEELKKATGGKGKVRGIILSGSPFSVHEPDSPRCSP